jgi:argonaute-like protein implicated in RNA metabolism and viral defense
MHGTVDAVHDRRRYYQGKSRIPAPLVLTRHHGTSTLPVLAEQLLGLSKMDWNSLDLYSKIPTTLRSSNRIARIGGLLDRLGANSYDYRLFI